MARETNPSARTTTKLKNGEVKKKTKDLEVTPIYGFHTFSQPARVETLSMHEAERAISDQNTERQNRSHYALSGHRRGRPKQKNRCGRNAASAERVPADGRRSGQTRREFDAILPEKLQHDDIDGAGLQDAAGLQFDDIHALGPPNEKTQDVQGAARASFLRPAGWAEESSFNVAEHAGTGNPHGKTAKRHDRERNDLLILEDFPSPTVPVVTQQQPQFNPQFDPTSTFQQPPQQQFQQPPQQQFQQPSQQQFEQPRQQFNESPQQQFQQPPQQQFQQPSQQQFQQPRQQFNEPPTQNFATPAANNLPPPQSDGGFLTKCLSCWSVQSFQAYFNVTTADVQYRIINTIKHFNDLGAFHEKVLQNKSPDIYGPFWITTTLIFFVAVTSNIASYFNASDDFEYDISHLFRATVVLYSFTFLTPLFYRLIFFWVLNVDMPLVDLICLYGYSLVPFLPATVFCAVPDEPLVWFLLTVATVVSLIFVMRNVAGPVLGGGDQRKRQVGGPVLGSMIGCHICFLLVLKLGFYRHVSRS